MKDLSLAVRTVKSVVVFVNATVEMGANVDPDVAEQDNQTAIIQEEEETPILDIEVIPIHGQSTLNTEDVLALAQVEAEVHRTGTPTTEALIYIEAGEVCVHSARGTIMGLDREEKKEPDKKLKKKSRGALQEHLERVLAKKRKKDNG